MIAVAERTERDRLVLQVPDFARNRDRRIEPLDGVVVATRGVVRNPDLGEAAAFARAVFQRPLNDQRLLVVRNGVFLSTESIVPATDQVQRPGLAGAVGRFAPASRGVLQGVNALLRGCRPVRPAPPLQWSVVRPRTEAAAAPLTGTREECESDAAAVQADGHRHLPVAGCSSPPAVQ